MKIIFNGKENFVFYIKIQRLSRRTIDYIHIYHSKDFLVEDILTTINTLDITDNDALYLNILLTKACIIKKSKTYTKLEGFIYEENGYTYDQDVIDILYYWDIGKIIDWRSKTESFKESYIKACAIRNYRQFKFINFEDKILDGNEVNSTNDLYILLGELFYGEGGFFGHGLDGLYDYLIDVGKHNFLDKINFLIINEENLILKLKEDYYKVFVNILEEKKINIVK